MKNADLSKTFADLQQKTLNSKQAKSAKNVNKTTQMKLTQVRLTIVSEDIDRRKLAEQKNPVEQIFPPTLKRVATIN